ncbi:popeye domain-containing protein 1-like [Nomia melanderi]|uniref:popeye domain-containing protein 1-like n=1 Tax=Nomia melanderi TaxID=2448451 RepID=UPI0013046DF4|nr:blood vessel epicardial substance-like [Nomia melanderi]XP_031837830.1 blood vessel epicardial substance-like [Nomia melanderi]XP_031837831.1 blood vessel epicardial substance-like [Nomia melanderi]XP_031837832.1 blood vessel epicardial substance-like [Nomia melanderi]XP_031837833.1 blood vessel epicardial substance-like [Nomia melanderi]XP_031837834.1 blood vessel epicardial substance-like [Nomia melanderi]XP_031837835.1 blood vessel epicardial substance-like [Nomia melanderi]XP_03183783
MARTTRSRRKMANTTDAPSPASSLLSSTTTTPFSSPTSTSYSTEGYTFNYSGLPSLGGYSLEDLNYTELWADVWNSTEASNVTERLNTTVLSSGGGYCDEWEAAQHKLFQAANLFFAAAFLVPRSFKASVLALRTFLTAGFMLAALWAGITICALDAMLWCLALGLLNGIHSLILACRFLPPALSPELAELYLKLFKPYKVSKKHFQELAKEARILKLDSGQTYATEGVTPADARLSILLRGKLKVTCDGTHLHYIKAYQFVDSPEWEAMQENIDDVFQVTIRAEESSTYICWTRLKLLRVLRHRPLLKVVLNTLIGKDITSKLYALNEQLAGVAAASETTTSNPYRGVARSLSVDAVNTETAGRVRSTTWKAQRRHSNPRSDRSSPSRYSHQYWAPVVANHFPPTSPFTQGQNLGYSLLPQGVQFSPPSRVPLLSHQPLTRQRSGGTSGDYTLLPQTPKLERKRSKKGTREVTFETPV